MAEETKIIRIVVDSSRAVDGSAAATRAFERMERQIGSMDTSMARMERALGSIAATVKTHLALAIAEVVTRLSSMAAQSLKAVAGLDDLAEQLGVTTKFLQASQYAASQGGVKIEQLESAYSKFNVRMGEAAEGSKEVIERLQQLGVKNLDLAGKLRPTEALMQDVAAAIVGIEDPAKRAAAAADLFGKTGVKLLPMMADIAAGADAMATKAAAAGAMIDDSVVKSLKRMDDQSEASALKMRALFATIGAPIVTTALESVNTVLASILANLSKLKVEAATVGSRAAQSDVTNLDEQIAAQRGLLAINPNNKMALSSIAGLERRKAEAADRVSAAKYAEATTMLVSGTFPPTEPLPAEGGGTSTIKGGSGGDDIKERMRKALQESKRGLDEATAFAAAANQGAEAVAKLEIYFKSFKVAQDVFGKAANDNTKGVAELTAKLEEQALATQKLKNVGEFRAETQKLREQNEILEAEVRLTNELPDIRARELATLKVMQQVKAKGLEDNKEDIADRIAVVETNERLKSQAEELRRVNELWTAPLKKALESIQQTAADAFEGMLNSGKFNFEELGQVFKKMVIRMAAEFMALATVRPVMSVILNAVSPGMASTMGVGGASGGGGFSMPSMGGGMFGGNGVGGMFGDAFSGVGNWLKSPITPTTYNAGYGAAADYASLSGTAMPSGLTSGGQLGGLTWGQGIGSALGIGMGAYQAITSKSLGGTLGGIGTMIGSGMMLIPGMQIPGMIVSALSAILPSIIGEPNTRTHSATNANLRYGDNGWYTTGGAWGPGANSGQGESALRGVSGGIDSLFNIMGGVKDASKVWGLNASSWTAQGKDWSYTSNATHLVDPNGNREAWRMNTSDMMDTGAAQVAIRSMLSGAVGELSASVRTALLSFGEKGMKEVGEGLSFVVDVYEKLGKVSGTVEPQLKALTESFSSMSKMATKLNLSLAPIEAEEKRATERLAQDYIDGFIDPIAVALRSWADEKEAILANVEYIGQNTDVVVDMARINEALLRREAALKEQLYGGAISQLEDAIRRLSLGDLSNGSPTTQFAGLGATYNATLAQARAGDAEAIQRLSGEAVAYAEAGRAYNASSPQQEALVAQMRRDLAEIMAAAQGPRGSGTGEALNVNDPALQQLIAVNEQLQEVVRMLTAKMDEQSNDLAAVTAQLRRVAVNP